MLVQSGGISSAFGDGWRIGDETIANTRALRALDERAGAHERAERSARTRRNVRDRCRLRAWLHL